MPSAQYRVRKSLSTLIDKLYLKSWMKYQLFKNRYNIYVLYSNVTIIADIGKREKIKEWLLRLHCTRANQYCSHLNTYDNIVTRWYGKYSTDHRRNIVVSFRKRTWKKYPWAKKIGTPRKTKLNHYCVERLTVRITILAAWSATFTVKFLLFNWPESVSVVKTIKTRNVQDYCMQNSGYKMLMTRHYALSDLFWAKLAK